ncbi:MAG: AsmA family protein, partial [Gammaproteobacteria bacterium]
MRLFLKITLGIVGVVAILLLSFIIYLTFFFDVNDFKSQIKTQFKKLTGREIVIGGKIEVNFFPTIGFKLNDAMIKNIEGFDQKTSYIKARHADVRVYFLPLFIRRVNFERVVLNDVVVNLIKNKQGKVNWKLPGIKSGQQDPEGVKIKDEISLERVLAENITVNWQDLQKRSSGKISNINLLAEKIKQNKFFPIHFTFSTLNKKTKLRTNFRLKSQIKIDSEDRKYYLKDVRLEVGAGKNKTAKIKLQFIGNFKITPDGIHIKKSKLIKNNDTLYIDNLGISGFGDVVNFKLINLVKKLHVSADLYSKQFKLKHATIHNLTAKVRSENGVIRLYPLKTQIFSGDLNGKLSVSVKKDQLFWRLNGSLRNFNLQSVLQTFWKIKKISGTGDFGVNLSARGGSFDQIVQSLNGSIK